MNNVLLAIDPIYIGGTAQFALTRQTLDVDANGDGVVDLVGATVRGVALSVSDVRVVVDGVATLRVSGQLALASVTAAGGTTPSYTALKMGNVTVSTEVVSGSFALTGDLTISRLEMNNGATPTAPRLDWTKAFDFNGDGTKDLLDPGAALPTPVALPIDFNQGLSLLLSGSVSGNGIVGVDDTDPDRFTIDPDDPDDTAFLTVAGVSLSGSVSFAVAIRDVDLAAQDNATLTTFALRIDDPVTLRIDTIAASITSGALAVATIDLTDGTQYFG
ncbi:MAG: hypothetical protein HYU51_20070, partial [Candidatus Rokubacteria bacterium]|nr:hypothetical protein [Candidatus Rokubacteria bacterium]